MERKRELEGVIKKGYTTTEEFGDNFYVTVKLYAAGNYGVNFIKSGDEVVLIHKSKK